MPLQIKVGDSAPLPEFTLYDSAGAVDLSSAASGRFIIETSTGDFVAVLDVAFVAGSSTAGVVTIAAWTTDATGSSGDMHTEIEMIWQDGTKETFPNKGYFPFTIDREASTSS